MAYPTIAGSPLLLIPTIPFDTVCPGIFHSRLRVLGQRHQREDFHLQLPVGAGL